MNPDFNRPMTIGRWSVADYEKAMSDRPRFVAEPAQTVAGPDPIYFDGYIPDRDTRRARFFPAQYAVPEIRLDLIEGALLTGASFVFTDDGHALAANSRYHDARWMVHQGWSDLGLISAGDNSFECERLGNVVEVGAAYNVTAAGWGNYHHILIDMLPRLWALTRDDTRSFIRAHGVDPDTIPVIVNDAAEFLSEHIEALGLGISRDRIVPLPPGGSIRAEKLFVPHFLAHFAGVASHELVAFYANTIRRIKNEGRERAGKNKIFHLRRDVTNDRRAIRNVDAIADMLIERGIRELRPNTKDPREGWLEFANASHVVGAMGSNLSNTVFCPPGARILCVQSDASHFVLNSSIAAVAEQRVGYVFGPSELEPGAGEHVKFELDLLKIREALDALLS